MPESDLGGGVPTGFYLHDLSVLFGKDLLALSGAPFEEIAKLSDDLCICELVGAVNGDLVFEVSRLS